MFLCIIHVRFNMSLLPVYIAVGGALGTMIRYYINMWNTTFQGIILSTAMVNMIGSFGLGIAWSLFESKKITQDVYIIIAAGMLGGLTTFSGFTLNLVNIAMKDSIVVAIIYMFSLPISGTLFGFLGVRLVYAII